MVGIKKDYSNLLRISLGFLAYVASNLIKDSTYKFSLLIMSIALFVVVLFDPFLFYTRKIFKKSLKLFGFILAGIIILGVSIFLYLKIGLGTTFYIAIATFIVSYVLTGVNLFCKKN